MGNNTIMHEIKSFGLKELGSSSYTSNQYVTLSFGMISRTDVEANPAKQIYSYKFQSHLATIILPSCH